MAPSLRVIGDQFAGGSLAATALSAGECLRITTGAPIPPGADTVVVKENCELVGEHVRVVNAPVAGANIRRAGEDVRRGDRVLRGRPGADAGRARSRGGARRGHAAPRRKPTVAVFTTGDELQPPGSALAPGQIYDSNRVLLQTLLIADGSSRSPGRRCPTTRRALAWRCATPPNPSMSSSPAAACPPARRISCRRCWRVRAACTSGRC